MTLASVQPLSSLHCPLTLSLYPVEQKKMFVLRERKATVERERERESVSVDVGERGKVGARCDVRVQL